MHTSWREVVERQCICWGLLVVQYVGFAVAKRGRQLPSSMHTVSNSSGGPLQFPGHSPKAYFNLFVLLSEGYFLH